MSNKFSKAEKLLAMAGETLKQGERETAKDMAVLAMRQEDAVDMLNRLLPKPPEVPDVEDLPTEEDLSDNQIARILALTRELQDKRKFRIANQILAKIEKLEAKKKTRKKKDK